MDWPRLTALGLGVLRLSPESFWSLSPREFAAALRGAFGLTETPDPMSRADLESLLSRHPDEVPS